MSPADQNDRPSPDALLRQAQREARGRLKVFLGAAPGVGKTFEMLREGAARRNDGADVVIGVVETHGRAETEALVHGFEIIPKKQMEYEGRALAEMDIDAIIARRPQLVLVDELAHTNAPGSRHPKRYQDVEELLAAGIEVYSTLNVQHLESLNDVVAGFTKVRVRETLPDRVIENAELEIVDIPPDELIERLKAGKVYIPDEATRALSHFFSKSNLSALRELALRRAAQAVDTQMLDYLRAHALAGNWAAGERIVVAISELPGAEGLVRAAKRLADALRAPWTAVHIETPREGGLGEQESRRLADVMQLATQLGAQVISVPARSVLEGLKQYTVEARATQLVVGKSTRSRWFELRHGSIVDRLVRETPGVAVHVLPMDDAPAPRETGASPAAPATGIAWKSYLISILMVAAVTAVASTLGFFGNVTNAGLLFLLPVMAAASFFGLRPGIFTGILGSLAYNFFFIPPLYTFTIQDPRNIVTVLVLLGIAIVTSQLAARVRGQADIAQRSATQNAALAGFARTLTGTSDRVQLAHTICAETARLLDARTVLFLPSRAKLKLEAAYPPEDALGVLEMAAAEWAFEHNQPAGRGSDTLIASDWLFRPIAAGGKVLGVIGLIRDYGDNVRADQMPLLMSLIDQGALALERVSLEREMASVARLRERDRLRAALLSSVSHDLRTPLTSIMAAVNELKKAKKTKPELLQEIAGESERLSRFVSNMLDMVRVEAGGLHLDLQPVDLTEAVAAAADELRRPLEGHRIDLAIPPDLPLVQVDPQLFHQCLVNLLENAAKYGGEKNPIAVTAKRDRHGLSLSIIDCGPGLPTGDENRVFETFVRVEGSDRKGGTGLGLAIVKGFAEAMGLEVTAVNNADRPGACFAIHFPEAKLVKQTELAG